MNFIKESLEVEVSDGTIKGQSGDTAIYLWHFWSLGGSTVRFDLVQQLITFSAIIKRRKMITNSSMITNMMTCNDQ